MAGDGVEFTDSNFEAEALKADKLVRCPGDFVRDDAAGGIA